MHYYLDSGVIRPTTPGWVWTWYQRLSLASDILRQSERLSRDFHLTQFLTYDRQSTCIGGLWWDKFYTSLTSFCHYYPSLVASLSTLACMYVLYCVIWPLPCRVFVSSDSCTRRRKQTAIRHFMQYCHCEVPVVVIGLWNPAGLSIFLVIDSLVILCNLSSVYPLPPAYSEDKYAAFNEIVLTKKLTKYLLLIYNI